MSEHDDHSHLTDMEVRVRALRSLLTARGYVDPAALDEITAYYEHEVGPHYGAQVVARAWTDPAYAERLRQDATAAIAELGFGGRQGEHMVALFNTAEEHNVVVCTLCSCYPWTVLGVPPTWYKTPAYRSRVVVDPRGVLSELGFEVPAHKSIRVWDSTAEVRYLVIPERPSGTEGLDADALAALVGRDAMIGAGEAGPVA